MIFHPEQFKPEVRCLADDDTSGSKHLRQPGWWLCLATTYFHLGSDVYEQVGGVAVFYHLSPVLANIYNNMQDFEQKH